MEVGISILPGHLRCREVIQPGEERVVIQVQKNLVWLQHLWSLPWPPKDLKHIPAGLGIDPWRDHGLAAIRTSHLLVGAIPGVRPICQLCECLSVKDNQGTLGWQVTYQHDGVYPLQVTVTTHEPLYRACFTFSIFLNEWKHKFVWEIYTYCIGRLFHFLPLIVGSISK